MTLGSCNSHHQTDHRVLDRPLGEDSFLLLFCSPTAWKTTQSDLKMDNLVSYNAFCSILLTKQCKSFFFKGLFLTIIVFILVLLQ